jgi:hypothetical protein
MDDVVHDLIQELILANKEITKLRRQLEQARNTARLIARSSGYRDLVRGVKAS